MAFLSPQASPIAPQSIPTPAPVPPAPERSDEDIATAAALQRKKYGVAGGASNNAATGGMGVNVASTYSAVTALLGGGRT